MEFNVRGDKIEVTDAINNYINEKLSRLNKYFENPEKMKAVVVIRSRGVNKVIEVTIPIKKTVLRSEEDHKDLYAAIDKVTDKLERQIRKNKTKIKNKKNDIQVFFKDFDTDLDVIDSKIVKRKIIENKPMSEEEAILQMDLVDHDFFIFENTDTDKMSVLYKRKEGNYGIIEIK